MRALKYWILPIGCYLNNKNIPIILFCELHPIC